MITAVPKSGWIATRKNKVKEIIKGIKAFIKPIVFSEFNLWKYLAINKTNAILANSDTCKLNPPIRIHLLAPIPVYPKNRVPIRPRTIKIKSNSDILNINLGWSIIMKKNIGKKIINLLNWFKAQGSKFPSAAE